MGIDGVACARAGMKTLRALLILGRVSNLPTVWSNCLCGWVLVRGTNMDAMVFGLLITGATLIYLGGMFLNDACDATWDREHRAERPIPAGAISEQAVWRIGIGLMAAGMFFLCLQGGVTALLSLMLFNTILVYNFVHKKITWSPLLIALCRWWLILIAAAFAHTALGVETAFRDAQEAGQAAWVALVLFGYVAGLSVLAKEESTLGAVRFWPCLLLLLPVARALLMNGATQWVLLAGGVVLLWVVRCLQFTFWTEQRDIGRTVGGLLAGMVLLDLLAVAGAPTEYAVTFLLLFGLSLAAQRWVPAT